MVTVCKDVSPKAKQKWEKKKNQLNLKATSNDSLYATFLMNDLYATFLG